MKQRLGVYVNPCTGERAVVRLQPADNPERTLRADLHLAPGGAVVGEHTHAVIVERFTVVRGRIGFSLDGRRAVAGPGESFLVPAGVRHDWWNAGEEEALVRVEVTPGDRFQEMILNLFGLAQDGKTNARGVPGWLQLAVFAREFDDVIVFSRPPRFVQVLVFALLAPLARLVGLRGTYPKYINRGPTESIEIEADALNVAPHRSC